MRGRVSRVENLPVPQRLVEHLERAGFVVMKKPPARRRHRDRVRVRWLIMGGTANERRWGLFSVERGVVA